MSLELPQNKKLQSTSFLSSTFSLFQLIGSLNDGNREGAPVGGQRTSLPNFPALSCQPVFLSRPSCFRNSLRLGLDSHFLPSSIYADLWVSPVLPSPGILVQFSYTLPAA